MDLDYTTGGVKDYSISGCQWHNQWLYGKTQTREPGHRLKRQQQ